MAFFGPRSATLAVDFKEADWSKSELNELEFGNHEFGIGSHDRIVGVYDDKAAAIARNARLHFPVLTKRSDGGDLHALCTQSAKVDCLMRVSFDGDGPLTVGDQGPRGFPVGPSPALDSDKAFDACGAGQE